MSVRLKALLLFFSLYISSVFLLSLFSVLVVRTTLHQHMLNYVEYQVEPLIDFYQNYYKNPNQYAHLLAEDVVSREITSILLDKKGRVISVESFLEGELPMLERDEIEKMLTLKRGIGEDYAFILKRVGDYQILLLGKLDRIKQVERRILTFTLVLLFLISIPASALAFFLINKLLEPLSYLREISESISKGELDIDVKRSGRRDEFGLLEEAYANMVDKLKGIILWQREFIRNITHALKTPLTYIRGQAELLQMKSYPEERLREIYQNIQLQSEKMERLISQLTTIMRLESQMPLKVERVGINQLFAELEEEYEFIKAERKFTVEYLREDSEMEVDKEYFKMALRNLIENAYKYTTQGQSIRLYHTEGCIVVEDEGMGMEHPERVGELFYREATDREGSGLGLYIVKLICQKSGMEMKVESKKGVGTKVSLCYNLKL
ncbi:MAG: HAMP domain-containing sensor histidine kinase [Aquificaceae bacterium]|nr:HAMP domain-containing histidine kinase [Aquificaceae bacterium]MDW8095238.1 HAMP domain-containing sensor histidine kinase [Aquificaceae bacterium]MDW8433827.1 HAMP domain-containing sensor histidine kinase [Aquificaceae bacterium]